MFLCSFNSSFILYVMNIYTCCSFPLNIIYFLLYSNQMVIDYVTLLIEHSGQICKDKDEAEIWFVALRALISRGNCQKWRNDTRRYSISSDNSSTFMHRYSQSFVSSSGSDIVYEVCSCCS